MSQPPSPAEVRIAAILRGLRAGAGMTTYQLAEAMGWSQSQGDPDRERAHEGHTSRRPAMGRGYGS